MLRNDSSQKELDDSSQKEQITSNAPPSNKSEVSSKVSIDSNANSIPADNLTPDEKEMLACQENFQANIKHFSELGYKQIFLQVDNEGIIKEFNNSHPQSKIVPIDPYRTKKEIPLCERAGLRLFEKDGKVHTALFQQMLSSPNCPPPKLAKNQQYIYMVVLKEIESSENEDDRYILELRVVGGVESGHPKLIRSIMIDVPQSDGSVKSTYKEGASVMATGEFYLMDGACVLVNDKSGNFFAMLRARGIDPVKILDYFFKPFYTQQNPFYYYLQDEKLPATNILSLEASIRLDKKLAVELSKRGFVSEAMAKVSVAKSTAADTTTTTINTVSTTTEVKNTPQKSNADEAPINKPTPVSTQTNTVTTRTNAQEMKQDSTLLTSFTMFSDEESKQSAVKAPQTQPETQAQAKP